MPPSTCKWYCYLGMVEQSVTGQGYNNIYTHGKNIKVYIHKWSVSLCKQIIAGFWMFGSKARGVPFVFICLFIRVYERLAINPLYTSSNADPGCAWYRSPKENRAIFWHHAGTFVCHSIQEYEGGVNRACVNPSLECKCCLIQQKPLL